MIWKIMIKVIALQVFMVNNLHTCVCKVIKYVGDQSPLVL